MTNIKDFEDTHKMMIIIIITIKTKKKNKDSQEVGTFDIIIGLWVGII